LTKPEKKRSLVITGTGNDGATLMITNESNVLSVYLDPETDLFSVHGTGDLGQIFDDEHDIESQADAESFAVEWAVLAKEEGINFILDTDLPHGLNWDSLIRTV
jgi:hypothetical protein